MVQILVRRRPGAMKPYLNGTCSEFRADVEKLEARYFGQLELLEIKQEIKTEFQQKVLINAHVLQYVEVPYKEPVIYLYIHVTPSC